MARMIQCAKLGKEAEGLDFPPLPGELGKRLYENVSKEAWQGWLKQQTMLINENRLNMADPRARQYVNGSQVTLFCVCLKTPLSPVQQRFRVIRRMPQRSTVCATSCILVSSS